MFVEEIKNSPKGKVKYISTLIRETYRHQGKVKHRTLANISKLPAHYIEQIKRIISQGKVCLIDRETIRSEESREYGASYAVVETIRNLGLDRIIYSRKEQWREDVVAMIAGRVVYQGSKLSLANLYKDTALWQLCGHKTDSRPDVEKHCYDVLDRLLDSQSRIQKALVERHLTDGCLILYDITSCWFEGRYEESELVAFGRSRDMKRGHEQIAIGLLTDKAGRPVVVEVFKGNTSDQTTVLGQARKLMERYGIKEIIFAGDRGMLTPKRIIEINEIGFKTLTALTHPQIIELLERKVIQPGLFDIQNIVQLIDPDNPSVRYMLCKNPFTEQQEKEKRAGLIERTVKEMEKIAGRKKKSPDNRLCASVGKILARYKVGKFFQWEVKEGRLKFSLNQEKIQREEQFDGCYIIRTDVEEKTMNAKEIVDGYRSLTGVEKAFRNLKTVSLEIRPVYHHLDERIRAHVFLCMLAYYVQWHMCQKLLPLFENAGKGKNRQWSLPIVLERLKSIRIEKNIIEGVALEIKTTPDKEQQYLLDLLGVKSLS